MSRALITGIGGQDGAYLAQLLLSEGYEVFGTHRPGGSTAKPHSRLEHLGVANHVKLLAADIEDTSSMLHAVKHVRPDEVYNLAAQSSVVASWDYPAVTACVNGLGVLNVLEAIRLEAPQARFYQASSSEMFGGSGENLKLSESASFNPTTPYATAKLFGHIMTANYRTRFGLHACRGILFNHESPLRGMEFLTRKVTSSAARIKHGLQKDLHLGNLDIRRDWGHAKDYVRAIYMMMQQDQPDDYVVATGRCSSVRDICRIAFEHVGLDYENYVVSDSKFIRPVETSAVCGDARKAREKLAWQPEMSLEDTVREMVDADMFYLKSGKELPSW